MRGVQALRRSVAAERVVLDVRLIVNGPPALANAQEDSHRRREEDFSALVPVTPQPNMLMRLTQVAANALHNLVVFVANLKRTNANEMYVRRVLQEQVGIDPLDLDVMAMNHRYVYRLSVRHNIEPVVAYLRSQGLTGSALAHFLAGCPATLAKDVDDTLMPLCEFLRARLGDRAIGVLVKHPPLAEVAPSQLRAADQVLKAASVPEEHIVLLLWQFPDLFARLARAVHTAKSQQRNGGAVAGDLGGREALGRGIIAVGEALVTAARVSGMKGGPQGIRGELERSIRIIEGSNN